MLKLELRKDVSDMEWIIVYIVFGLLAIYLFLLFPTLRRHPDRELMRGMYVAHRGLHAAQAAVPENSMKAFSLACELGFCIEIDIHLTRDGHIVVFHDDTTKRVCGKDLRVEECTLAELRELRLLDTDERIPTLEEVLSLINGKVLLLIEFKSVYGNSRALCTAAENILSKYQGKYIVQSFYPPVLYWYRKNRPQICRGQLSQNFIAHKGQRSFSKILAGWLLLNFLSRPDFVSYNYEDANTFSRGLCIALGAFSVGWTFRDAAALADAKPLFDTYIFENFLP